MSGTQAATVDGIVRAAITELSQVPGLATQIYSTPRLQQYVQNAVLMELEEKWWINLMSYFYNVPIDPLTGWPTIDLVHPLGGYVDEYADVAAVWTKDSNKRLLSFPRRVNPQTLLGQTSKFYIGPSGQPHRPITVWPPHAHEVTIFARHRPVLPMTGTDRIWLDRVLILYDVCWMYAVDDGTIPAQINKFQVLATNRRRRLKAAEEVHGVPLNGGDDYDAPIGGHDDSFFVLDRDPLA